MIAFVVCFIIALVILLVLDGYARHMGNPEPTDWVTVAVVAALAGLIGSALWMGLVEATRVVAGMLA
jgi:uncharacterized membrane protein